MVHEFRFSTLDGANEARSIASKWLSSDDDERCKTVHVEWNCPSDVVSLLERREWRAREAEPETYGQVSLSEFERRRIDFTQTNVFHAASAKAIALENGTRDWLAKYDTELTVDEHKDVYGTPTNRMSERGPMGKRTANGDAK